MDDPFGRPETAKPGAVPQEARDAALDRIETGVPDRQLTEPGEVAPDKLPDSISDRLFVNAVLQERLVDAGVRMSTAERSGMAEGISQAEHALTAASIAVLRWAGESVASGVDPADVLAGSVGYFRGVRAAVAEAVGNYAQRLMAATLHGRMIGTTGEPSTAPPAGQLPTAVSGSELVPDPILPLAAVRLELPDLTAAEWNTGGVPIPTMQALAAATVASTQPGLEGTEAGVQLAQDLAEDADVLRGRLLRIGLDMFRTGRHPSEDLEWIAATDDLIVGLLHDRAKLPPGARWRSPLPKTWIAKEARAKVKQLAQAGLHVDEDELLDSPRLALIAFRCQMRLAQVAVRRTLLMTDDTTSLDAELLRRNGREHAEALGGIQFEILQLCRKLGRRYDGVSPEEPGAV